MLARLPARAPTTRPAASRRLGYPLSVSPVAARSRREERESDCPLDAHRKGIRNRAETCTRMQALYPSEQLVRSQERRVCAEGAKQVAAAIVPAQSIPTRSRATNTNPEASST